MTSPPVLGCHSPSDFVTGRRLATIAIGRSWERAQPFRMLCHNGEINTIEGNVNLMRARESDLGADWTDADLVRPVIEEDQSDSAKLDNALELLTRGGRDVRHAQAMLVPAVWEGQRAIDPDVRDFYRYHSCLVEPWDGPAGLIFTDGRRVGAALDRNGLRPLRYLVCEDGYVIACSEVGAVRTEGHGAAAASGWAPARWCVWTPMKAACRRTRRSSSCWPAALPTASGCPASCVPLRPADRSTRSVTTSRGARSPTATRRRS
ncbi:MAG TPA: hypothetical protein VG452_09785 [Egibacteraceae bacterium]|nr:hypothetical protein [Egibacteraceae bacterium]